MNSTTTATETRTKEINRCRVWKLYGNDYDLRTFLNIHPGGRRILESAEVSDDATPMFESYHAFSDIKKLKARLNKYKIKSNTYTPTFTFAPSGFYYRCKQIALDHARMHCKPGGERLYYKASYKSALWSLTTILVGAIGLWQGSAGQTWSNLVMAAVAGVMWTSTGFNIMHTTSHYALYQSRRWNDFTSTWWHRMGGWNADLWASHHVVFHHSFTGDVDKDPDAINIALVIKDELGLKTYPFVWQAKSLLHKIQAVFVAVVVLCNLYTGQSFAYLRKGQTKTLWNIPLPSNYVRWKHVLSMVILIAVCILAPLPMTSKMAFVFGMNVAYAFNIIGDHETFPTVKNTSLFTGDWGEIQVRNSGNFMMHTPFQWYTMVFGGINYQIEHHLFPSMAHEHYPYLSPAIQKLCKEYSVPYVCNESLFLVLKEFVKTIQYKNKWN